MQCEDVTELLLSSESDLEIERHVHACERCAHVARGLGRLNAVLQATLVCEPPLHLQQQLADVALGVAKPQRKSWLSRVFEFDLPQTGQLVLRPNLVAVQGLAAVMLALASWQVFAWLSAFQPMVGDVGYALQLVATSPASTYIGGLQIDVQALSLWSVVGVAGWLFSEAGPIGRRLTGPRLP